ANLIYLDVIASGATSSNANQPLTANDVELFQDGKPLKIAEVTRVDRHLNRTLVLVVDDLGLSLEGLRNVRLALGRFAAEQVQPGDRIAIAGTGAHLATMPAFTSDRTVLNATLDRI